MPDDRSCNFCRYWLSFPPVRSSLQWELWREDPVWHWPYILKHEKSGVTMAHLGPEQAFGFQQLQRGLVLATRRRWQLSAQKTSNPVTCMFYVSPEDCKQHARRKNCQHGSCKASMEPSLNRNELSAGCEWQEHCLGEGSECRPCPGSAAPQSRRWH